LLVYTRFENKPQLFSGPEKIISCHEPAGLKTAFDSMERALKMGYFLAGFVSYEAGYGMEDSLAACCSKNGFPLLMFGCYKPPKSAKYVFNAQFRLANITTSIPFEDYKRDIDAIRAHIAAGDVYQITYCLKQKFNFEGSGISLFTQLLREQPVPYPAYIKTNEFEILSLSPEMFLKKKGNILTTKPMKGTWPRGANPVSDLAARFRLKYDPKNRAENVMIADLLRNDLGRIGSGVRVERLFELSGYRTLYQMTSTVSAKTGPETGLYSIFSSLLPSGSVTGAPKIRAMQIIRGMEREERKIYTGAIGYITPERDMFFNVPIRTILLQDGRGEMGVGGGIIWDSTPHGEWDEGMLKSKFLTDLSFNKPT